MMTAISVLFGWSG